MNEIRPLADRDIQLMQILKNRLQPQAINQSVAPWDVARLEAKFKSEMYVIKCIIIKTIFDFILFRLQISTQEYTPYFSLGACMDGLNLIFNSLFKYVYKTSNFIRSIDL